MKRSKDEPYHITIEIVNKGCRGLRMLKDLGIQRYSLSDVRGLPGGLTRHLVRMPSEKITEIPEELLARIHGGGKYEGGASVWFDSDGCDVCRAILSHNSFLISGRHIGDSTMIYSFVAPNFEAFKSIVSTLEASGLKPKTLEVWKFRPKGKILTERQERALWLGLKMGFFEFPRKITMLELSRVLGVKLSTLSEITRRGMRRLLEHHFET